MTGNSVALKTVAVEKRGVSGMKPKWIVYDRSGGTYPVALDTALDWDMLRDYCVQRMLPGPWETIRCSNLLTAQDIAIWLNGRAGEAG